MEEIWSQLKPWIESKRRFAIATVVGVQRSSPRGVGSCLAVSEDGSEFIGSVSAGCVENEVIEAAKRCIDDGDTRWLEFGPELGYPWEVALSCGGKIRVRVERYLGCSDHPGDRDAAAALEALLERQSTGLLLSRGGRHALLEEGSIHGSAEAFDIPTLDTAQERLREEARTEEIDEILYRLITPKSRLFIVGAVHIATHLVPIATTLNYRTLVIDPRAAYAIETRFPQPPDRLYCRQPDDCLPELALAPSDAAVALTHDPKIDDPALLHFSRAGCGYIGALGSRKSHAARLKRLAKSGLDASQLDRIKGPVGLDIGSRTPAEIAVSIMAEIIALRRQPRR